MTIDTELSDTEMEAIDELQRRMNGDMETELFEDKYLFLRFLKACNFHISNAEAMLRKNLEWREKNDIKSILKFKKNEVMEKYIPYSFLGHDKEGCVVRYIALGSVDAKGILSSLTFEELTKLTFYESEVDTEELKKQSKKLGRNVDKCVYIENMENFNFAMATDKKGIYVILFILKTFMNNYPDRLKTFYVINANIYFNILYSIVKPILPKTILEKVKIYTDDSYKEDLLEVIDADVLPSFFGGNKTDPDGNPLCLSFLNHGGLVPEHFYLTHRKKALAKAADVQKITLTRATFHEVNIEVKEPGSYLEWEFETKCRDIGFGLFYQKIEDGEEKISEIVPIQRIDTDMYPETGTFKCDIAGTYVIVFDNTYSWVRAKEIYYRVKVASSEEYECDDVNDVNKDVNNINNV